MSLEDRYRQALADTISEVKTRLETEFDAAVSEVRADADRVHAATLADARNALMGELQAAFDSEKAALVSAHEAQLAQAADAGRLEVTRLTEAVTASDAARQEAADAQGRVKAEADATVEAVRTELREAQAIAMRQREEAEAAVVRVQEEHEAALAQVTSTHEVTIAKLRESLDTATRALGEQTAEAARLRELGESGAQGQRAELDASAAKLRAEFDAEAASARQQADSALAALRADAQSAATLHSEAVDAHQTGTLRLLESVRTLDAATSLAEVLDALTTGASQEAGRAAMLVVKGDRLIGWRTLGFGALDQEARSIESRTSDVDALAAAVNTGRSAVVGPGSVLAAPAFSGATADRPGLAVPLLVAGRPVAVLYADPGAASPATAWTSPVEVLVRHAARCLEGLAVQRATVAKTPSSRVGAPA